jgi:D-inositol-3-phosphate glycosyltransferase
MCFRVAMLSLHTSPLATLGRTRDAGGMNVYIRELARELGRGGIYVDIFTRRSDPDTPFIYSLTDHVRVISIPAGPDAQLPPNELYPYVCEFTRRILRLTESEGHGYDLIHSHYWLSAVSGMQLARAWGTPHVTMFHTVERLKGQQYDHPVTLTGMSAIRAEQEGRISSTVNAVTVASQHEADQLHRLYSLPSSRLRLIPCGVDLNVFTPGDECERREARQMMSPDGMPTLLFVGRLDPIKGIDLLLESVAQMRTQARLVVVGGNPQGGDPEVERLRSRAAELGIGERVDFPGAVPHSELSTYYRGAEALVVTSRYESFGLVAVEALACGTPVVASRVGGLPSIIRDGENGMLVNWRAPEAFAERLDALLTNDEMRTQIQQRARSSVERFDWRRIGDEVRELYQRLTEDARCMACSCF